MNLPVRLLFGGAAVLVAVNAHGETLQCKTEKYFKDGASSGIEVRLSLGEGKIHGLFAASFSAPAKETGRYACYIDSAKESSNQEWSYLSDRTILKLKDDFSHVHSIVEIVHGKNGYIVNLAQTSPSYCRFGAEWPGKIGVREGRKTCEAKIKKERVMPYHAAHKPRAAQYRISIDPYQTAPARRISKPYRAYVDKALKAG